MPEHDSGDRGAAPMFVHLSDIHFDARDNTLVGPNAVVRESLLGDLADCAARLGRPDAVLVSGDVAFSGQEHEYAQAHEFLREVTGILGIDAEKVLVIPGNHDVNRQLVTTSVQMLHDNLRTMSPLDADKQMQRLFAEPQDPLFTPLAAYNEFAAAFHCEVSGEKPAWEVEFPLGSGSHVKMRGITTAAVSDADDDRGGLVVGTGQTTFSTRDHRAVGVMMGHHPSDWWLDYDECEQHMRTWVSVHFLGHKHVSQVTTMNDSVRVVAGAVHPERQVDWLPGYNWVQLALDDEFGPKPRLQVAVWSRKFPAARNVFVSDTEAGGWDPDYFSVRLPRWERHNETQALAEAREAGEVVPVDDIKLAVPRVPVAVVEQFGAGAGAVVAGGSELVVDEQVGEEAVSHREPLTDNAGRPQKLRTAIYKFSALGYADQQRLLLQFDLIEDGDEQLRHDEARLNAFARLGESGRVEEFIEAMDRGLNKGGF